MLPDPATARPFIDALTDWFEGAKRDLPWRRPPHATDPYAVLVSEIMLQQTRVDTVVPYFERWMKHWPTIQDLAEADTDEVLAAWAGLGYYSRARRLLQAARIVVEQHASQLPANPAALRALPGLGPYATGAVASIAFDIPLPAVDGNVARVVARLDGRAVDVREPAVRRAIHQRVEPLMPTQGAGGLNVAFMELGATVCTPRAPRCSQCPVESWCEASLRGETDAIPVTGPRARPRAERVAAFLVERDGSVLLRQRPAGTLLGGLWGLPMGVRAAREPLSDTAARALGSRPAEIGRRIGVIDHVFSHRRWAVSVHRVSGHLGDDPRDRWASPCDPGVALSRLDERLLEQLVDRSDGNRDGSGS